MITFRRLRRADDPEFCKILDTFCDDLFRVSGNTSLESIRNGQDVLFKPVVGENNDVDQAFVRSFVISMGKNLTEDPTFREPQTLVTVAECVQGLGRFLELIPPRTIASTVHHATSYIERSPAQTMELQDTTRRIKMVLGILRGVDVATRLLGEVGILQLVNLDEGALHGAINDASQFLDETAEHLVSTLDILLEQGNKGGEMSLARINIAVSLLKSSIEQTLQLYKMADTETAAYRKARNKWAGCTALSLAITVASWFIPGGPAIQKTTRVMGALSTVGCGYKTCRKWGDMKDSDQVRKLVFKVHQVFHQSWIFLTVALWRHNGLPDNDERLVEFANRMADAFNVQDLLTQWGSEDYATQILNTNRTMIAQDMRDIVDAVRIRRNISGESQPAEGNSAHTDSPDHNVQENIVEETMGQDPLQNNVSGVESAPTMGGLDSSSVNSETDCSTAGLDDIPDDFWFPSLSESHEWESGADGSDLDFSGLHTPTEESNYWDH
ncbi:hypothetical protein FOXG_15062 [Fusarium oxysporum f. sp. lycopersici 4287]|uniref:Uncharacterized protein n=1 Tax=Fusarium oxysporum f. sp. lycopersici (strain 4287 / CBS 123668 / FGSC 9935 / NRRL 34936) TaxID=426428 RepID=A0A0J9W3T3_FUSO4|nr:hypothetical protein FOXG_15062 [Fusarium oxysporum f. sp. lycopersici 4287]KNB17560.1 hypothetical protein FOXG_15062 [Fusarium oxysporum f. sp. lycopersici 4287]